MSDKTREVYKDTAEVMATLNPFVEPPRMRVSTINRINELIDKAYPKPMKKLEYRDGKYADLCPSCDRTLLEKWNYCPRCGQRVDRTNYEL